MIIGINGDLARALKPIRQALYPLLFVAGLANAGAANAAPDFVARIIGCSGIGGAPFDSPQAVQLACSGAHGHASASASSTFGHLGIRADATHTSGFSVPVQIESFSLFRDFVIFTSSDPNATTALIAVNLDLSGTLRTGVSSFASIGATLFLPGSTSAIAIESASGVVTSTVSGFSVLTGVPGATTDLSLRSGLVLVSLNVPTLVAMTLNGGAGANDTLTTGMLDFGSSFEFPAGSDAFLLPAGVTANAGTWLVDNRRVGLATGGVPEPAAWALMLVGFGLAGTALRRSRLVASNP